jgi:hypothetical protein
MNTHRIVVIAAMVVIAALASLIPHPPNFTPLAAMALFAGAHLNRRAAFIVAIGALLIRDLVIGFHILMPAVYVCYLFNVFVGQRLNGIHTPRRVVTASVLGSVVFFLVSNFAVWALLNTFPKTPQGLLACYTAGIPYFRNTLASDLLYSVAMFGIFALAQNRIPSLQRPQLAK